MWISQSVSQLVGWKTGQNKNPTRRFFVIVAIVPAIAGKTVERVAGEK